MGRVGTQEGYGAGRRRREQILQAALELVLEQGHASVTVQMVAARVGITDAAVFYHFRTKEHLFVELLRYRDEHSPEAQLGLDGIDAVVVSVRNSQATPHLVALFADMASRAVDDQHPSHDYFTQRYDELQRHLTAAARTRVPDAPTATIEELVHVFIATTDGLQRRWLVQRDIDMAAGARTAATMLFGVSDALDGALRSTQPPLTESPREPTWM